MSNKLPDNNSMIYLKSPMDEASITNLLYIEEKNNKEKKEESILKELLDIYTVK